MFTVYVWLSLFQTNYSHLAALDHWLFSSSLPPSSADVCNSLAMCASFWYFPESCAPLIVYWNQLLTQFPESGVQNEKLSLLRGERNGGTWQKQRRYGICDITTDFQREVFTPGSGFSNLDVIKKEGFSSEDILWIIILILRHTQLHRWL